MINAAFILLFLAVGNSANDENLVVDIMELPPPRWFVTPESTTSAVVTTPDPILHEKPLRPRRTPRYQ